ncbi:GNAT family N-acetyltransferase [Nocardiopsis sp. NPDC050513]|uniref:GNAT family N-acetyltransferase n=1 Tax=Nocardiopsis sp. NPDC050513 TaxID=3364338 RepID=UPI0037B2E050
MNDWHSETLTKHHDLTAFDCGVPSLNDWLVSHALRAQTSGTARTQVWVARGDPSAKAYYALAPSVVHRDDVSRGCSGGVTHVPAYLLARLALDNTLHGQGLGGQLLLDALEVIVAAASLASGRLVVVDAIDEAAASFYRKYGFQPVRNDPRRLVLKIATARKTLGL